MLQSGGEGSQVVKDLRHGVIYTMPYLARII
jgi:hypothetical protein